MTFEEFQQALTQMLAVQRELQESQLKFREAQELQRQEIQDLLTSHQSREQEIQGMLAVQRELQESQLQFREVQEAQRQEFQSVLTIQRDLQESQLTQRQAIEQLLEYQQRQQTLLDRLIGYSLTNESDHLDLEERMNALERRIQAVENR